jgi:hypothetical protein
LPSSTPIEQLRALLLDPKAPMFEVSFCYVTCYVTCYNKAECWLVLQLHFGCSSNREWGVACSFLARQK